MKTIIISLIFIGLSQITFAQRTQEKTLRILNGKAIKLPKPKYPEEAKKFCASGKVEVEVTINQNGDVIDAKAVSGDEILWDLATDAAKRAKFAGNIHINPIKIKGIIVYNFVSKNKCLTVGIVNSKATFLPKPVYPKSCRCAGLVKVRVVIDMNGDVIHASAISGNPLLRVSALESARKAKFPPTFINTARPVYVVAFLEYNFKSDGEFST
jgi:TonB family protein